MSFETLQQAFERGRIDRRTFIKRAAALGALSAVPAGLLSQQARADEPKRGGHLRVATVQGSTTDGLDPATLSSGFVNMLWYTAYTQLTEVNAEGELEPLLAESYEPVGGPDKWLFTLRKDVEFHNGKTVDSNDVIQSLRRAQGEQSTSSMKSFAEAIVDMKADGPGQGRLHPGRRQCRLSLRSERQRAVHPACRRRHRRPDRNRCGPLCHPVVRTRAVRQA